MLTVRPNFKINRLIISYSVIFFCFSYRHFLVICTLGVPYSLRDLNEYVRVLKPFLIIIAVSYCDSDKLLRKMHLLFKYGAIFIILIGFLEFFDVLGYRKLISLIYSGHRFENLDRIRTILMAGDPNIAAALVIYFVTYILQTMLMTKNKIRNSFYFTFSNCCSVDDIFKNFIDCFCGYSVCKFIPSFSK